MATYTGGIRDRLIYDSVWHTVNDALTALGWFNTGRDHSPVTLVAEQLDWEHEIEPNTIAFAPERVSDQEWELGSDFKQNRWRFYFDIFGENEALGNQLSGDIRDILRGKIPSVGRDMPVINVLDYTSSTPSQIFYCTVERVTKDRSPTFTHRWQRYLYVVAMDLVDYYDTVTDDTPPSVPWWTLP